MIDKKPKIFIFCNSCSPRWHSAEALTEDGCFIAGHVCSDHFFIKIDMGVITDCKHEIYKRHYPGGYEIVFEEDNKNLSEEFNAAAKIHKEMSQEEYENRMMRHMGHDDMRAEVVLEFQEKEPEDA